MDVTSQLGISQENLHTIRLSNDRSNVALIVCKMKYLANTYMDLDFLVQDTSLDSSANADSSDASRLPRCHKKFVIFFDDKNEAMAARDYLWSQLPLNQHNRIVWFMSDMS